ncbi:MAG: GntR family transcriptional regulator [Beijerinckiaceae bacterium]
MATERIRDAIVHGDLQLGEPLSEEKLAAKLGISRTPVREALATLHVQGLITIYPQRGSFVFDPTEDDVQELCEFRAITESRAMWLAYSRDRVGTLNRMRVAQGRMHSAQRTGDYRETADADAAFHDALLLSCGNQFLSQAYGIIAGRISAVRSMLLNPGQTWKSSLDEHEEIIAAFEAADLMLAEAVLSNHIMKMRTRYRDTVAAMMPEEDEYPPMRRRTRRTIEPAAAAGG